MFDQTTCRTYGCFCHREWTHFARMADISGMWWTIDVHLQSGRQSSSRPSEMVWVICYELVTARAVPEPYWKAAFSPMKWWILLGNKGSFNAFNFWNFNQFRKLSSSTYHVKRCKEIYLYQYNIRYIVETISEFQPNPMMLATLQVYTGSVPSWGKNSIVSNQYGLSTMGQSSCESYALSSHRTMWC